MAPARTLITVARDATGAAIAFGTVMAGTAHASAAKTADESVGNEIKSPESQVPGFF
jgi:hypothetical protein